MSDKYDHKSIEQKWQKEWEKERLYQTPDQVKGKENYFVLVEYPYPSGNLHIGHWYAFSIPDIFSRKKRMEGYNVLFPIGFDSFGLPAENAAIKHGADPKKWTYDNIDRMTAQIRSMGASFDWTRSLAASDPDYYKWTQWLFLKMYEKGIAYRGKAVVNWDPVDKTVLANEQVLPDGTAERSGAKVEKKELEQWFFRITDYADRLIEDLKDLNWPEQIKEQQRNWIGRSEGAEIEFRIKNKESRIKNALVIHGVSGHSKENWFPWIKETLEKENWKVSVPDMPNADHPKVDEWNKVLLKELQQESVVIGHSLGVPAALNLIQTAEEKINKLILVAPVNPDQDWKRLKKDYGYADWDAVKSFADIKFDWKKISDLVDQIIIYYSDNDPYIPAESIDYYKKHLPNAVFKFMPGKGHFNKKSGLIKFPEILSAIPAKAGIQPSGSRIKHAPDHDPGSGMTVHVFTTRPDTLFGATYMVLAPEHPLVAQITTPEQKKKIDEYVKKTQQKTELQRTVQDKEKTGVFTGAFAINPATKEEIPIWIADYVLMGYGTGAIMAVPAHDERDFEFAKKYDLPIKQVIAPETGIKRPNEERRDGGCAVIFDPKTQKYAVAKLNENGRYWLYAGGVNENEGVEKAVLREVTEESGLHEFEHVERVGSSFTHYYNTLKKVNRLAHVTCLLVVLKSSKQKGLQLEDHEKFNLVWTTPEDILKNWQSWNQEHDVDHWIHFLQNAVSRAVELGYDKTNADKYKPTAFAAEGMLVNSGKFDGFSSEEAKKQITKKFGKAKLQYKLRDWLVSRQRYWGAPIPVVYDPEGNPHPIPEKHLPWMLPEEIDFTPTGEPPLAKSKELKQRTEKIFGKGWRSEYDTMDTFVDSSWYFLRYLDPKNEKEFSPMEKQKLWMPIDRYSGGAEHTTMHLLYSRFFYKALFDLGLVTHKEPYVERFNRGIILGEDGRKMSKRWGNVIDPDKQVAEVGADSVRMYLAFIGPFNEVGSYPWNTQGLIGVRRFLDRVEKFKPQEKPEKPGNMHRLVKKITSDIDGFKFNTAIASFMEYFKNHDMNKSDWETYLKLLSPFAPHLTEELWHQLGHKTSIHLEAWPKFDPKLIKEDTVTIAVQVLGKLRATLKMDAGASEEDVKQGALADENVKRHLEGKQVEKVIFVPDKLINFVVK